jgi:hypothetical protein
MTMPVISIATSDPTPKGSKAAPASARTPSLPTTQPELSDARRFEGQPLHLKVRLDRAVEELFFFRTAGRHHSASETNEVRSHARWRREAVELARSLADSIVAGDLEPVPVKQPGEDE